jgi:molybdate transport system substrate-binding protein
MHCCVIALAATAILTAVEPVFTVAAAASLTDAVNEALDAHAAAGGARGTGTYAAASTLAKQIENGLPAQLFISADLRWADYLQKKNLLDAASRTTIAGNALVLIAPKERGFTWDPVAAPADLPKAFAGRWATGDPSNVPVGAYAQQALTKLSVWEAMQPRLIATADVRAALRVVELGEASAGIVYATDARRSQKSVVVATFPSVTHPPIVYPAAVIAGPEDAGHQAARAFLAFLVSAPGQAVLAKHGFTPPSTATGPATAATAR